MTLHESFNLQCRESVSILYQILKVHECALANFYIVNKDGKLLEEMYKYDFT